MGHHRKVYVYIVLATQKQEDLLSPFFLSGKNHWMTLQSCYSSFFSDQTGWCYVGQTAAQELTNKELVHLQGKPQSGEECPQQLQNL